MRIVTKLTDIEMEETPMSGGNEVITVSFVWGKLTIERTPTFSRVTYKCEEWMQTENGVCEVDYGINASDGSISISETCRGDDEHVG